MAGMIESFLQQQLLGRKQNLERAAAVSGHPARLHALLQEVDAALARIDGGGYGICEVCQDTIECERLIADPLVRVCLDHLSSGERAALESDLELAAQVQHALLPPNHRSCNGWGISYHYEPAGTVSGDYVDIVDAGAAGQYFMVGDVSGKGVSASILMSHMHAIFRSLISVGLSLRQMMEHASRLFCESTLPNQYATLVCGRAEAGGHVELCNAGHPPPLLVDNGEVRTLEASGLPVGMFCNAEFPLQELQLAPGQCLVIYSDGISEAADHAGAEYGAERLRGLVARKHHLQPADLVAACRDDLVAFRGAAPKLDDVTLLVLARTAAAANA